MGHSLEISQSLTEAILADINPLGRQTCRHGVIDVVQALERQLLTRDVPMVAVDVKVEHAIMYPCGIALIIVGSEAQQL